MSVRWNGLTEFSRDLHVLPHTLTDEARPIARAAADLTALSVSSHVARRTGRLAAGIAVESRTGGSSHVAYVVRSAAPHAGVYESGSGLRSTARGYGRGTMPAAHVLIPAAMRARASMREALIGMVRAEGLKVSG